MLPKADMMGKVFGRLTVISDETIRPHLTIKWLCRCECGTVKYISGECLRYGNTRSCGCTRYISSAAKLKRHGEASGHQKSPEYGAWTAMKTRCASTLPKTAMYYRNLGVTVCDQWMNSFETFLKDVGRRPSPNHSLDRYPDCHGNYEPGNVRWATAKEQSMNRRSRSTRRLSLRGLSP